VHTNDEFLHALVRNVMDFSDTAEAQKPCLHVRFYFDNAAISGSGRYQDKFLRSKYHKDKGNLIYNLFQHNATMVVKPAKAQVQVTIFRYDEDWKETLLHNIFWKPLYSIFSLQGLFFVHAALTQYKGQGVLISGGQHSGKSSISFALARGGFSYLSDDKCFIRGVARKGVCVFPFPTKIGINRALLKRYPECQPYLVKDFALGGKLRAILRSAGAVSRNEFLRAFQPHEKFFPARVILFPCFKKKGGIVIRKISPQETLSRLKEDSFLQCSQEKYAIITKKMFLLFSSLVMQADSFVVEYSDEALDEVKFVLRFCRDIKALLTRSTRKGK
jgi:hypothetical protein